MAKVVPPLRRAQRVRKIVEREVDRTVLAGPVRARRRREEVPDAGGARLEPRRSARRRGLRSRSFDEVRREKLRALGRGRRSGRKVVQRDADKNGTEDCRCNHDDLLTHLVRHQRVRLKLLHHRRHTRGDSNADGSKARHGQRAPTQQRELGDRRAARRRAAAAIERSELARPQCHRPTFKAHFKLLLQRRCTASLRTKGDHLFACGFQVRVDSTQSTSRLSSRLDSSRLESTRVQFRLHLRDSDLLAFFFSLLKK